MSILCRKLCHILSGVVALLFVESGFAYAVKELTLESKVKKSDIVFIGRVVSVSEQLCFKEFRCAEVEMLEVLKGNKKWVVRVLWDSPIAEFNPACCDVGSHYLFFLKRRKGVFFETVNAYHGVYELPKSQNVDNKRPKADATRDPGK
jgi:hypothetical protein